MLHGGITQQNYVTLLLALNSIHTIELDGPANWSCQCGRTSKTRPIGQDQLAGPFTHRP